MSTRPQPPLPARYGAARPSPIRIAPSPEAQRRRALTRQRRRRLLAIPLLLVLFLVWSFFGALVKPGNESLSVKWADWMRAHHAAFLISRLEAAYYTHQAPARGGQLRRLNALPVSHRPGAAGSGGSGALPAPSPVPLVVSPAVPGEGQWQPVGPLVNGQPAMYAAQFRADQIYTSQITSAVWIDPRLMKLQLVPGLNEPGGQWTHPPYITPQELPAVAAAFNGGFRFQDAKGGFYLDGRTAVPLVTGAASLVLYADGRVNVGAWGSEVTMTPSVVAVLQNLVPMVDNGQVSPSATYTDASIWGTTLGAATVVARSGVGVTADGALVYVAGPALTARTLAESLQRAGAVRAMTLDINPYWVTFNFFSHPSATDPSLISASKLFPQMVRPATRYLGPTLESRDFIMVSAPSP
ncbi:MAG: phosphodiester glycosidase family protein [Acidimicrobiales bacterium]